MSTLSAIKEHLIQCTVEQSCPIIDQVFEYLKRQDYKAQLDAAFVAQCCAQFSLTPAQLALHCVSLAACYALTPISHFYVGAVAIGKSGTFYFGANQEFAAVAIQQTVHAEQSAIAHAWLAGESAIIDIAVNATPCGHCRQFMNELNTADSLKIHLPHSQNNPLHSYLPDSFGPKDLDIKYALFDLHQTQPVTPQKDELAQAAITAARLSHAPYSQAFSGVALQIGSQIISGRYIENAAFNPSLPPLQSALNYRRLLGLSDMPVSRLIMAESPTALSHRAITEELARHYLGIEQFEYILL